MITNENMLNMLKELDREFPDNYGLREGLRIDAIDLKGKYDDDIDFRVRAVLRTQQGI